MSGDDGAGLVGAFVLVVVAIVSTWWWLIAVAVLVFIACLLSARSVGGGGVPVYRHEQAALDEIADTLRRIERSQYSD